MAAYVQLVTINATAVSLTASAPAGARKAILQGEGTFARYRQDNVAPTASVGMTLAVGASVEISLESGFNTTKIIGSDASTKVNITFF